MKLRFIFLFLLIQVTHPSMACTNLIVGKDASIDGSVMCTYSADDYGMFQSLCHFPYTKHSKGEMKQIVDWDTKVYHGQIPEVEETYNVVGNINEFQVTIGETTFGGRPEMVDTTGILDYGSLIYIALQRSRSAREAINIMTNLAETYGYCSEGETFTICDPQQAWILEMMGCGPKSGKVVWVAVRIPDNAICAHANQSRIHTFNRKDKENVLFSKNVVQYAKTMGWFDGKDEEFSFCDTYAPADFLGRRGCEARVWSFFNHFSDDMERYIPYVEGKVKGAEVLPLWIVPNRKISLKDLENCMRDHYEGTPFSLDNDIGGGIWQMPYRPTPLIFSIDSVEYFNERPISTQQPGFVYISQMRSFLQREIGGVLWFGNDDGNMVPFTPVYCSATEVPLCYNTPGVDALTFSFDNAYWVCNWVSNMVYPRYSLMFPTLKEVRDSLDEAYIMAQEDVERWAVSLYEEKGAQTAVEYLNEYGKQKAEQMLERWKQLAFHLIVKYNDMIIKPEENGQFLRTPEGLGARVIRPGYCETFARELIRQTKDKFVVPKE